LVAQRAALALEVLQLFLRLVDHALGLGQLRVALALDVDELRVLLGLARIDVAVLLAEVADAGFRFADRRVLRREHAAVDPRGARDAPERTEHLIERLGILLDLGAERLDRTAALPARAPEPDRVARRTDQARLGDLGNGVDLRRRERPIRRFGAMDPRRW